MSAFVLLVLLLHEAIGIVVVGVWMKAYSVPGVDAALVGMFDQRERFILVQNPILPFPGAVGHGAQDDLGDLETGVSQSVLLVWSGYRRGIRWHTGCIPSG